MEKLDRTRRVGLPVAAALLAALAIAPSAGAQLVVRSFNDGHSTSKSELAELASQLRSQCAGKASSIKSMTLARALARIQQQLDRNASAAALRDFARSNDARSAPNAAAAVFGALGDGKPWAAIDAALRVHQLDPRDAGPLISLAGLVTAQGMPQEGLALLNAAAKLRTNGPGPMGISYQAVALNNRGYALLLLGHAQQAAGYLSKAVSEAPLLTEAKVNLDAAQQCSWALLPGGSGGEPPVIADPPFGRETGDWTTDPDGEPVPVASSFLDLSQSREWTPITMAIPETPEQGGAMKDYYVSLTEKIEGQVTANASKEASLSASVHDLNEQTAQRRSSIWQALNTAEWQPELRPLYEAFESQYDALDNAISIGNGEGNGGTLDPSRPMWDGLQQCGGSEEFEACLRRVCTSETATLHERWKPQIAALNDAGLRYASAYWRYAMGVAANISEPVDHQRILLDAENSMLAVRELVVQQASLFLQTAEWAFAETCDGGAGSAPASEGLASQNTSPACPEQLNKLPKINLAGIFKFSIHCETIEFEVSTKGWVGAFANVTYNPKQGRTTVFAGGQLRAAGAKAQVGGFVTAGPNGVEDGGMRVSESTKGPSVMTQSHTVNFSVAGTVPFSQ